MLGGICINPRRIYSTTELIQAASPSSPHATAQSAIISRTSRYIAPPNPLPPPLPTYLQIVLASGEIVNANSTSHTNLTHALRGGSNNFGIVTAFDIRLFPQGKFWGGLVYNNISTRYDWFDAFASFAGSPALRSLRDPYQ